MEAVPYIVGGVLLLAITAWGYMQFNYREPIAPGFLDEFMLFAGDDRDTK